MADKKISQLTAATTPLVGTELVPIVQSGSTVNVTVSNITAGRDVSAGSIGINASPTSRLQVGLGSFSAAAANTSGLYTHSTLGLTILSDGIYVATRSGSARMELLNSTGNLTINTGNLVVGTAGKGIDFSANGGDVLSQYDEGTWTPTDASGAGLTFSGTSNNCFYTRVGNLVTCTFALVYPTTANLNGAKLGGLPFTSKATANSVAGGFITYTNSALTIAPLVGTNDTSVNLFLNTGGSVGNNQLSTFALRGIITYMV